MSPAFKVVKLPVRAEGGYYEIKHKKSYAASPIKDAETMRAMRAALADSGKYSARNLAIFDLGVASGRRCGDILRLCMFNVWDDIYGVKEKVEYYDQKTRTYKKFFLNEKARERLAQYLNKCGAVKDGKRVWSLGAFIFPSRKKVEKNQKHASYRKDGTLGNAPLTQPAGAMETKAYSKILKKAARDHGVTGIEHLSTHTMRKTFGYKGFREYDADFVSVALGHANTSVTRRYLGIDDEYLKDKFDGMDVIGDDGDEE